MVRATFSGTVLLAAVIAAGCAGQQSESPSTVTVGAPVARAGGVPLEFREIAEAEVRAADEIWVTSSSKEILAIVSLDGRRIGDGRPGPLFRRLYELYQEFKRKVMRAGKREALSA